MTILKLTGVFEILVQFKIIILKRKQMFLNYTFNVSSTFLALAAIWLIVFSCIMQISLSPRQNYGGRGLP